MQIFQTLRILIGILCSLIFIAVAIFLYAPMSQMQTFAVQDSDALGGLRAGIAFQFGLGTLGLFFGCRALLRQFKS